MSRVSLQLHLRRPLEERFDGAALNPSQMANMNLMEIERIQLCGEKCDSLLSDWFDIEGEPCDRVQIVGSVPHMDRLGFSMNSGKLTIDGDAGAELATQMRGGFLEIKGNCGDRLAQSMYGGSLLVHGDAGRWLGCALPGEKQGIRGGDLVILGNVADDACQRMRRGMVLIGGNVGERFACNLIAGTIYLRGDMGEGWGGSMRRGSIICNQPVQARSAGLWTTPRPFEMSFLPLLWNQFRTTLQRFELGPNRIEIPKTRWVSRMLGDRSIDGVAEVLVLKTPAQVD